MGEVIDLFSRQHRAKGEEPPKPDDYDDEAEFVSHFMEVHMGQFMAEVTALDQAETIEELESQIKRIKRLVGGWPRIPTR